MNIQKETIKEHFTNKKVPTGRGRFLKKNKDDMYAKYWQLFFVIFWFDKKNQMFDNTYGSIFYFFQSNNQFKNVRLF